MKNTTVCYLERGTQYLLLHRTKKENDENAGKWIGVGGKCEENESPEDCMLREVREETGLSVTQHRLRGVITFVSDAWEGQYMYLFTASKWHGALTDCDEGELAWVERTDMLHLPLFSCTAGRGAPVFLFKAGVSRRQLTAGRARRHAADALKHRAFSKKRCPLLCIKAYKKARLERHA